MPYRLKSIGPICLINLLSLLAFTGAFSQSPREGVAHFRSGAMRLVRNIDSLAKGSWETGRKMILGQSFHLVRFDHLPLGAERTRMEQAGVRLLDYIPYNTYVISLTRPGALAVLKACGAQTVRELSPEQKIAAVLRKDTSRVLVLVSFFSAISFDTATTLLATAGFNLVPGQENAWGLARVNCSAKELQRLATLPYVRYIEPPGPPPHPLTVSSPSTVLGSSTVSGSSTVLGSSMAKPFTRDLERAGLVQAASPQGWGLTGKGVSVELLELGAVAAPHPDIVDRLIPYTANFGDILHATLVTGVVGGAGLLNESYIGYAPGATLVGGSVPPTAVPPAGVVIISSSVADGNICDTAAAALVGASDQLSLDYPYLEYVLAAGNSGTTTCTAYPPGYHTVYSGRQSAKSAITVGSVEPSGAISSFSSCGPTTDGRIKPEIVAVGDQVTSTSLGNTYHTDKGTSLSAPAVAGGLALLYEEYRRQHNGNNPTGGLMKAVLCNTATDRGNIGPDFTYGFGSMNLIRALKVLDSSHYFMGAVSQGGGKQHTLTVPAGAAQLKVLLYWQDAATTPLTDITLVNDLDLEVTAPDGHVVLPYVLNSEPARVADPASRGRDHLNNIEQVVIDHPVAGTYTFRVNGYAIPIGDQQDYDLTYDLLPDSLYLTYPFGGTRLAPGEPTAIQWDNWGGHGSSASLFFSPDGGITWQPIGTAGDSDGQIQWTAPSQATQKALVKLVRNTDNVTSLSAPFTIVGVPNLTLTPDQCPGAISVRWDSVPGATDYEVMIKRGGTMVSVDTTTNIYYRYRGLSVDSLYWVTVRSRVHGYPGRRAPALSRQPVDGTCADNAYTGDLSADSLVAPQPGRLYTSTALGSADTIRLQVRNLSSGSITGYDVCYRVNGGAWVRETAAGAIPALGSATYSFTHPYNFSAVGSYFIELAVSAAGDPYHGNDTLRCRIRQLDNPPLSSGAAWIDNFDQTPDTVYNGPVTGLTGSDRFDFTFTAGGGRVRTTSFFITPTVIPPSSPALVLDYPFGGPAGQASYVTATYNLSAFDTAGKTPALSFSTSRPSSGSSGYPFYIRGSDRDPWILVVDLANQGGLRRQVFTDWAARLRAAGQNFSSSSQLRWTQPSDALSNDDLAIDNVRIYDLSNDLALLHVDTPRSNSFATGKTVPVRVTVRNYATQAISRVPVYYSLDGGSRVWDTIPALGPGDSLSFLFAVPASLSQTGVHMILAGVGWPGDSNPLNDTLSLVLHDQPLIRDFPYLENFEKGDGGWYPAGTNVSWALGTPASILIKGAASGSRAWKTNLTGKFNIEESNYLYSPFFDLSMLTRPAISVSLSLNTLPCIVPVSVIACNFLQWQYSTDSGVSWRPLPVDSIYNWSNYFVSATYYRWHVTSTLLPRGSRIVQFRLWFHSSDFHYNDGVGIDDIHIYDHVHPIDDPAGPGSGPIRQPVSGNGWTDFLQDSQVVVSIRPNGQDLGPTEVQAFVHRGNSRNFQGQYYLNRNWVIRPSVLHPAMPVDVRLYFLDRESDSLVFASGCTGCGSPSSAYRLGVSGYGTDSLKEGDDTILNDLHGAWHYLDSSRVRIVPFEKGYYAEFSTQDFPEFWMNDGGPGHESPLPVEWLSETATVAGPGKVGVNWTTASEINLDHFDLERAAGNNAYARGVFTLVTRQTAAGPSTGSLQYTGTDAGNDPTGVYYYRIRAVDPYGNYSFSPIMPVFFSGEMSWQVYPNPSTGIFRLQYQLAPGASVEADIYSITGVLMGTKVLQGNGFVQTALLNLGGAAYPAGIYFMKVRGAENRVIRLLKQGK